MIAESYAEVEKKGLNTPSGVWMLMENGRFSGSYLLVSPFGPSGPSGPSGSGSSPQDTMVNTVPTIIKRARSNDRMRFFMLVSSFLFFASVFSPIGTVIRSDRRE